MGRDLPFDILLIIFEMVGQTSDLLHLIKCSRAFRSVAEPILYRHINVKSFPRRARRLFETLGSRQDLAAGVRSLCSDGGLVSSDESKRNGEWWETSLLQEKALHQAFNLSTLDISLNPSPKSKTGRQSLRLAPRLLFLRLEYLVVSFHLPQERLCDLMILLRSQKALKRLELPMISFLPFEFQEGDVPLLQTFIGQGAVGEVLVRGRPVSRVILTSILDLPNTPGEVPRVSAIESLSRSTAEGGVRDLELKLVVHTPWPVPCLEQIAEHASMVESLRLRVSYVAENIVMADGNIALFRHFFDSVTSCLSRFRRLQLLDLHQCSGFVHRPSMSCRPGFVHFTGDIDANAEKKRLESWSRLCPTLSEVVMPNGNVWKQRGIAEISEVGIQSNWCTTSAKGAISAERPVQGDWRRQSFATDLW